MTKSEMNTKETIKFFKNLQHELNTQETDCQASPIFWVVGDYEMVKCSDDDGPDEYHVNAPNRDYYGEINELLESIKEEGFDNSLEKIAFDEIGCNDSAIDWLEEYYDSDIRLIPVREQHIIKQSTMFITKADAKAHIKSNYYHYSPKAHTYAMTAWRSPTVNRLLKALKSFDWSNIEESISNSMIGDTVRVSGDVYYGNEWHRVACEGVIQKIEEKQMLLTLDYIDGDNQATVFVDRKYIHLI